MFLPIELAIPEYDIRASRRSRRKRSSAADYGGEVSSLRGGREGWLSDGGGPGAAGSSAALGSPVPSDEFQRAPEERIRISERVGRSEKGAASPSSYSLLSSLRRAGFDLPSCLLSWVFVLPARFPRRISSTSSCVHSWSRLRESETLEVLALEGGAVEATEGGAC